MLEYIPSGICDSLSRSWLRWMQSPPTRGWRLSDAYLQLFEGRWNEVAAEEFGGQQLPDLIATATQNTKPKPIRHELIRAAATIWQRSLRTRTQYTERMSSAVCTELRAETC